MNDAMIKALARAGLFTSILLHAAPAFAHAHLQSAAPAVGGTVAAATEIRLTFSEAIEPKFSGVTLTSAAGELEPLGASALDPNDDKALIVTIAKPLPSGVYKVTWRATSVDAHHTQGDFSFTVKP